MLSTWTIAEAQECFALPFNDLLFKAHTIFREHFNPNTIQISTLLSIKTSSCSENCSYCAQSAHNKTNLPKTPLIDLPMVIEKAKRAKKAGATRLCMGAAWRGPQDGELERVCEMIKAVKAMGLEACVTLGMLKASQVETLKAAGLDYYNHNIDTSPEYYPNIVTTRKFSDRLETLELVRKAGIKVCSGGILGLGETNADRIGMLVVLANLPKPPDSVPINQLVKIPGTPLENAADVDALDFVRTIALARIMMPKSYIRLSAGREIMSDELQALCFFAGANSMFYGEELLTTSNPLPEKDDKLLERLGIQKQQ